jgi:hypothetical protein
VLSAKFKPLRIIMASPFYEVVSIVSPIEISDTDGRTYPYQTPDGIAPAIGHGYVVEWSSAMAVRHRDKSARHHESYRPELNQRAAR